MHVLITGSSGLIGKRLVGALLARGDTVIAVSRRSREATPGVTLVQGDPTHPGDWQKHVADCDAAVNLAGEPITEKRWNATFLEEVKRSRVESTRLLAHTLAQQPKRADGSPKCFIAGSAVGYYGKEAWGRDYTETDAPGGDVMAQIGVAWEAATQAADSAGVRVVNLRTGIVLDRRGGALPKLALPFKLFVGGPVGHGKQYMNWIHHADMTGLILHGLDQPAVRGAMNATAPSPVTNAEFSKTLAAALHRPNFLPVPVFALHILLGQVAEVLAGGQRALPTVAILTGYRFEYDALAPALKELYSAEARPK